MGSAVEMGRWEREKECVCGVSVSNQTISSGKREIVLNEYMFLKVAF